MARPSTSWHRACGWRPVAPDGLVEAFSAIDGARASTCACNGTPSGRRRPTRCRCRLLQAFGDGLPRLRVTDTAPPRFPSAAHHGARPRQTPAPCPDGSCPLAKPDPRCSMTNRDNFSFSELEHWLNERRVTEIECLVPDLTGVARGKILPREKFTEDRGMRLPEAVVAMGVTGEFPEEGPYYDVISPPTATCTCGPTPARCASCPGPPTPRPRSSTTATTATAQLVPFAPRSVLRRVCDLYAAKGWDAGGGARAGVLPGGPQHRPRYAAEAADRPQRPQPRPRARPTPSTRSTSSTRCSRTCTTTARRWS
jgi:hypothetical protein